MCLERSSILDDLWFPTEVGDGEGDESEDTMHLSEARQQLYDAIENWEFGKDANMSRLPWKNGYHEGEHIGVDPQEWSVTKVGYLTDISVTYKTSDGKLTTKHTQVADNWTETKLQEMLARRSITYPD